MSRYIEGYKQGYKDGMASAALPNVNDNGDKIDGYSYEYKTDSNGEPYIHIDSVRSMLKKAADVQPVKHGEWGKPVELYGVLHRKCSCCTYAVTMEEAKEFDFCPKCGARMDGDAE